MKKGIFLVIAILSINLIQGQDYKFGKVSQAELEEKHHPLDASASASYLYKNRSSFFEYQEGEGFRLITEIHVRLKIYNPKGFDYATKTVSLYKSGPRYEKFHGLKAYTYNLIDGKIEAYKLKKDAVFSTEASFYRDETKFTMSNVKEGSVIEYKYRIVSPFATNVNEFKFQYDIPVKKLVARFQAPEYYKFKTNIKGFLNVMPTKEIRADQINFTDKSRGYKNHVFKTSFQSSKLEFNKHIWKYNLSDIPALREEPHVNNINNYRSAVKYELSSIEFPNTVIESFASSWDAVVKKIYMNPNFGTQLDKSNYYKDDVNILIEGVTDPLKQVALLFNHVKSKVKWNGYYSKYTLNGVRKAYKDRVGNVAEINLMLTSMLRYAGINANPVLVSTRKNGIPLFPTREGYNYVVSSVELPNGVVLLDATSKYSSPNILPFRVLNWEGRIIRKNGSSDLVSLYPNQKSKTTISMLANLNENGDLDGVVRTIKTAHKAMEYRASYIHRDKDEFLEKLEHKYDGIEISELSVKNELDLAKPVVETYNFVIENQTDIIGDKMYVSPMFFLTSTENPFKLENREFPVDFGYPSTIKYRINITLPKDYLVESLPDSKRITLPENLGAFKYVVVNKGDMLQLIVDSTINTSIISPEYYVYLKEYFKQYIEKENEKVVLKRIEP